MPAPSIATSAALAFFLSGCAHMAQKEMQTKFLAARDVCKQQVMLGLPTSEILQAAKELVRQCLPTILRKSTRFLTTVRRHDHFAYANKIETSSPGLLRSAGRTKHERSVPEAATKITE